MQVTQERLDPCQVALTIEVEEDKVVHALDRAYREYSKYITVPGFRKGKAPLNFVKQRVPETDVRQRTAEILVEPAYAEALKETEIEPYAQPQLELVQLEFPDKPFIFKALVPLAPVVELGEYTGLAVDQEQYTVLDADVESEIERLRNRSAQFPLSEAPAKTGDVLIADVTAKVEGRPELDTPQGTMIEIGGDNIEGFDEQVIGTSAGDTKTFTLTYPDPYVDETLSGKEVEFTVTVKEVREKIVPALDDELAQSITNGKIESLDTLRHDLKEGMQSQADQASDNALESNLIQKIVDNATVQYPPVLVENELKNDFELLKQRLDKAGRTFEEYLEGEGKSQTQLIEEMREQADRRVRVGLVLSEIVRKEELGLTDEDLNAYITELAISENATPAAVRAMVENRGSLEVIQNRAQTKKVIDFLKGASTINVVALDPNAPAKSPAEAEPAAAETEPAAADAKAPKASKAKAKSAAPAAEPAAPASPEAEQVSEAGAAE